MTPQEKAKEIVGKYYIPLMKANYPNVAQKELAKQCALLETNAVIDALIKFNADYLQNTYWSPIDYHEQVKYEIFNL